MMSKSIHNIISLLEKSIGLHPDSLGIPSLEAAINTAGNDAGINDLEEFYSQLITKPDLFERLIQRVVVPETWFFRDQYPFTYLRSLAKQRKDTIAASRPFSLLSVPCSTGEEPYSIAMTLIEAGYDTNEFHIDAIDINMQLLSQAKAAFYGKSSFRGDGLAFRDRFFDPVENGYCLKSSIVNAVKFNQGNLIDSHFLAGDEQYDIVFCKNLLIYLNDNARKAVLRSFDRLLKPEGTLFVGHTELMFFCQYGYKPVSQARAFACIKSEIQAATQIKPLPVAAFKPKTFQMQATDMYIGNDKILPVTNEIVNQIDNNDRSDLSGSNAPTDGGEFERIKALADSGRLSEAKSAFLQLAKDYSMSSEAYCLAGVVDEASDDFQKAEENYIKSIYLDPNNYEAMLNLSLLYRKQGDSQKADIYLDRARRIDQQKG